MKCGPRRDRDGFALALVVLMLFAVAVAAMTGYQVVSNEVALATQNRDAQSALDVARAGMQRFVAETVGQVGDSVSYAIGNGIATVTTRKVVAKDPTRDLYYLESSGRVTDPRMPAAPATRTVGMYAWHELSPVPLKGAVWISGGSTVISGNGGYWSTGNAAVSGNDQAAASDCVGAPSAAVAGVVKGSGGVNTSAPGTLSGSPNTVSFGSYQAMYDATGIRWDVLADPDFPVDFQDILPVGLPADSFPVVRFGGDLTLWSVTGQGVLIVTGRLTLNPGFIWSGIVLAGELDSTGLYASYDPPSVRGMLIGGLNGANPSIGLFTGTYSFDSCAARAADRSLSYLKVVEHSLFEVEG